MAIFLFVEFVQLTRRTTIIDETTL